MKTNKPTAGTDKTKGEINIKLEREVSYASEIQKTVHELTEKHSTNDSQPIVKENVQLTKALTVIDRTDLISSGLHDLKQTSNDDTSSSTDTSDQYDYQNIDNMPPSKKSKMSFAVSQEYCTQGVDKQCSNDLGREESSFRFQFAAGKKRPQKEKRVETSRSKSLRLQSNLPNNEETSQSSTKSERDINVITQINDSSMDITADRSIQGTLLEATLPSSSGAQLTLVKDQVDIKQVKRIICKVLQSYHAILTGLPPKSLQYLTDQLYASGFIGQAVKDNPSMNDLIGEFKAYLDISTELSEVQEDCGTFLKAFIAVGGSYSKVAYKIRKSLVETVVKETHSIITINLSNSN